MGRNASKAQFHFGKIEHFYKFAGSLGYSQSTDQIGKLTELLGSAVRSRNGEADAMLIRSLIRSAQSMIAEMKIRQIECPHTRDATPQPFIE